MQNLIDDVQIRPNLSSEEVFQLALVLLQLGRRNESQKVMGEAKSMGIPESQEEVYNAITGILDGIDKELELDFAFEALKKAAASAASDPSPEVTFLELTQKLGLGFVLRFRAAEQLTSRLPTYAPGWFYKGELARQMGRPDAYLSYKKAFELDPEHEMAKAWYEDTKPKR